MTPIKRRLLRNAGKDRQVPFRFRAIKQRLTHGAVTSAPRVIRSGIGRPRPRPIRDPIRPDPEQLP
ncbi:MAG TPA: hypothetical protein VN917_05145, partial [Xanthobacteraceae bacterium]|nr:hypothetical protein [Xanthobacteraceae bacterium]